MLSLVLCLTVLVVGLLAYALSANPKVSEIGRLAYFAALLGLMVAVGALAVRLL